MLTILVRSLEVFEEVEREMREVDFGRDDEGSRAIWRVVRRSESLV